MSDVLIATRNQGKLREYTQLLDLPGITLRTLNELGIETDVDETGTTFAENARLKAETYMQHAGCVTLGEDSGLEVAALNGAPGIYSARYGGVKGRAQLEYLLEQLKDVPFHARLARFVCVIALARPGGEVEMVDGVLPGVIEFEPTGTGGFGYDPLFWVPDTNKTLAELTAEEKNAISHRAVAVRAIRPVLERWQAEGWL